MTRLAHAYVESHGLSYTVGNDVMGVYSSSQAEFYRRVLAKYEDSKIEANGDVLPNLEEN
jgi:hypothetical protein